MTKDEEELKQPKRLEATALLSALADEVAEAFGFLELGATSIPDCYTGTSAEGWPVVFIAIEQDKLFRIISLAHYAGRFVLEAREERTRERAANEAIAPEKKPKPSASNENSPS